MEGINVLVISNIELYSDPTFKYSPVFKTDCMPLCSDICIAVFLYILLLLVCCDLVCNCFIWSFLVVKI